MMYFRVVYIPKQIVETVVQNITLNAGVDPEMEEGGGGGGGGRVEIGGRVYRVQLAVDVVHTIVGGSGGMLPQENLELMRMLLRPSETTITTQNLWSLTHAVHVVVAGLCNIIGWSRTVN